MTIGRRDGHGYLDAMEREHGVVGRLLAHGVLDKRIPPLWESRPEDFPLAGEVLALATGLVVHSRYVEERARAAGYEGPICGRPAPRLARARRSPPADVDGRPAVRRVRQRQREQARAAAPRGVRAAPRRPTRARGCCSSARRRRASTSTAACSGSGSTARGSSREGYVDEAPALGADGRLRRPRQPALADDGRDVGHRDPRARRSASRSSSATSAGSPSCPDDVALKVPVDDGGGGDARRGARAARRRGRTCGAAMGGAARELARREHDLDAGRRAARSPRSSSVAGGGAVDDAVLREVSEAAAAVGIAPGSPEARRSPARLAEVDLGG